MKWEIAKYIGVIGVAVGLYFTIKYYFLDTSHHIYDMSNGKIILDQTSAMAGEWFYFKVKIDEPFEVTTYPKVDHSNIRIEGKIVKIKMPNKSIKVNVIPSETETHQHDNKPENEIQKILDSAVTYHIQPYSPIIHHDSNVGITINGKLAEEKKYSDYLEYISENPNIRKVEIIYSDKITYKDSKVFHFYVKEIRR